MQGKEGSKVAYVACTCSTYTFLWRIFFDTCPASDVRERLEVCNVLTILFSSAVDGLLLSARVIVSRERVSRKPAASRKGTQLKQQRGAVRKITIFRIRGLAERFVARRPYSFSTNFHRVSAFHRVFRAVERYRGLRHELFSSGFHLGQDSAGGRLWAFLTYH